MRQYQSSNPATNPKQTIDTTTITIENMTDPKIILPVFFESNKPMTPVFKMAAMPASAPATTKYASLNDSPATINVRWQVQSVVAKATFQGRKLSDFTDTSFSAFLLSPLPLVKEGDISSLRAKEASHLQKRLSLQLQPLRGNQPLNLSIFQSLKVCTFRTFASPPPLLTTSSLFSHC